MGVGGEAGGNSKNVKKSMYINVFYEENLIIEEKCIIEFNTSD